MPRLNGAARTMSGIALAFSMSLAAESSLHAMPVNSLGIITGNDAFVPASSPAVNPPTPPAAVPAAASAGVSQAPADGWYRFIFDGDHNSCRLNGDDRGQQGANHPSREAVLASKDGQCSVLTGFDFAGAALGEANFNHADLSGADLRGADLHGVYLREAALKGARLGGADLTWAQVMTGDLERADFSVAPGQKKTNLTHATLMWTDLTDAKLQGAVMVSVVLTGSDLSRAQLQGADLTEALMMGADLSTTNLDGATLTGAVYDADTKLPFSLDEAKRRGMLPKLHYPDPVDAFEDQLKNQ